MTRVRPRFGACSLVACACVIAATVSNGQSAAPSPADSHVGAAATSRDPFWPVGYVPKPKTTLEVQPSNVTAAAVAVTPTTPVVSTEEPIAWPELKTRGIMHDRAKGKYWATMEGIGIVEVGDAPEITKGSYVYRFEIRAITATGVSYEKSSVRKVRKSDK